MRYPYKLKRENMHKAIDYIKSNGRDIDIALCNFYFNRSSEYSVINILSNYINPDGGFGKGLELDYLYEGSTPLSTTLGLDVLRKLKIRQFNHITLQALEYLERTQCHNGGWRCINIDVNTMPRALWWEYEHEHEEIFTLNPTAEIAGYYYIFGTGVYRRFANDIMDKCYTHLLKSSNGNKMHEIICLMRLTRVLPADKSNKFARFLLPRLKDNLCLDTNKYSGYVFAPLSVFESPYDPLYDFFSNAVQDNLDYLIETQQKNGCWNINYNWNRYEFEFDEQIQKIQSKITLDNLILLKNFNRIL